jgi:Winged helix DNA-binding domain
MVLSLTRDQIIAFRLRANGLNARLPMSPEALRSAAWAGLQDSMPRAALLSIHARVADTPSTVLDDPTLLQVWGPRYAVYVIAAADLPTFTLARLPDDDKRRRRDEGTADRLGAFLEGRRMKDREVHAALETNNSIRYATTTGRVVIRWEGAFAPTVWMVPRPEISVVEARTEMARRYLHLFGPTTAASFAEWAGIGAAAGAATFAAMTDQLAPVGTPNGDAWLLAADETAVRAQPGPPAAARLLPSGDTFFLLWGRDRELLVLDDKRRQELWTSRVWPGALLIDGQVAGVWRRANEKVSIDMWRQLSSSVREAVEAEAASLPLPALTRPIKVSFAQAA